MNEKDIIEALASNGVDEILILYRGDNMNYQNFKQMVADNKWNIDDIKSYYDNWLNNWISSGYNDYDAHEKMLNAERYLEEND